MTLHLCLLCPFANEVYGTWSEAVHESAFNYGWSNNASGGGENDFKSQDAKKQTTTTTILKY